MLQRTIVRAASRSASSITGSSNLLKPLITARLQSTAPATVVDRGFWRSLIPKPMRKENRQPRTKSKEWNPATFFIVIFLLIGSMSIQMIALRNSFQRYMRQSEIRIGVLREVVERIQRGEKVDVEEALGTGNPEKEADWEEILQAIENDNATPKKSKAAETESSTQKPEVSKMAEKKEKPSAENVKAEQKTTSSIGNFF